MILEFIFGVLLISACCQAAKRTPTLKDGPCPSVFPVPNFYVRQLSGHWFDILTTYERIRRNKNNGQTCVQNYIQVNEADESMYLSKIFSDKNGKSDSIPGFKFIPIPGQRGKFSTQVLTDKGMTDNGWIHTIVAFKGESYMEFACKMVGGKHKDFNRIRSRSAIAAHEDIDDLLGFARANGDNRPIFQYNQSNCNYE